VVLKEVHSLWVVRVEGEERWHIGFLVCWDTYESLIVDWFGKLSVGLRVVLVDS
jgi:hypothetical protein